MSISICVIRIKYSLMYIFIFFCWLTQTNYRNISERKNKGTGKYTGPVNAVLVNMTLFLFFGKILF